MPALDWITIADEGYQPLSDARVGWGVQLAVVSGAIGGLFSFAGLIEWALAPEVSEERSEARA